MGDRKGLPRVLPSVCPRASCIIGAGRARLPGGSDPQVTEPAQEEDGSPCNGDSLPTRAYLGGNWADTAGYSHGRGVFPRTRSRALGKGTIGEKLFQKGWQSSRSMRSPLASHPPLIDKPQCEGAQEGQQETQGENLAVLTKAGPADSWQPLLAEAQA